MCSFEGMMEKNGYLLYTEKCITGIFLCRFLQKFFFIEMESFTYTAYFNI